ncbi:MAG TPA: hypothetical protein VJY37_03815 [Anaerovoracaceae bacterium]|nr:hypothetical protein [Anaerovoracaceae bacterium]
MLGHELQPYIAFSFDHILKGYSMFLKYINDYRQEGLDLTSAIDEALKRCIAEIEAI